MATLDLTGLRPLDTTGLRPAAPDSGFDVGGLKPLDVSGLRPADEPLSFTGAMARGVDVAQGMGYGAVEALGEATGSESLRRLGQEGRERNVAEAAQHGRRSEFTGIRSLGDFGQWAKETIGEQIPIMAPSVAGGLAGAGAGALVGGPVGATIGGMLGAFAPSLVMGVGEVQGAIKEKDKQAQSPGWAFAGGTAIAALDSILPAKVGSALVRTFGRETAEQIAQRALSKPVKEGFIRRTAGGAVTGMATEGLTEAVQEAIGEVAGSFGAGTPIDWEGLPKQMIEAGAAGALVGGGMGAVSGAAERPRQQPGDAVPAESIIGDVLPPEPMRQLPPPAAQQYDMLPAPQQPFGGVTTYGDGFVVQGEDQPVQALPSPQMLAPAGTIPGEGFYVQDPAATRTGRGRVVSTGQPFRPEAPVLQDLLDDPRTADEIRADLERSRGPRPGFVRFYHGGQDPTSGGGRWVTPDPEYARNFRASGTTNEVHYVDIPIGDPVEVAARMWDEIDERSGTNAVGRYGNVELPETWAKKLKPFEPAKKIEPAPGSRESPVRLEAPEAIHVGADRTAQPTPAQAQAGNYQKRHVDWEGLKISIETEAGQERSGVDRDGKPWSVTMPVPYGYIKRTEGADGDQLDVYIGPTPKSPLVFVIDQITPETGAFDEHKALVGFPDQMSALDAYYRAFSDGRGPDRIGAIRTMPVRQFKAWVASGETKKPLAYEEPIHAGVTPQQFVQLRNAIKDRSQSLDPAALAKKIGADPAGIRRALARLAGQPDSGLRQVAGGKFRRTPNRGPLNIFQFLASIGGVRDEGRELSSRDLHRTFLPGIGPLVRPSGLSLDEARARAVEAGYLQDTPFEGGVSTSTVNDLLELIDQQARGRNVYAADDRADVVQREQAQAAEEANARFTEMEAEIRAIADEIGVVRLTDAEVRAATEIAMRGEDLEDALVEVLERTAYEDRRDLVEAAIEEGISDAWGDDSAGATEAGSRPAAQSERPAEPDTGPAQRGAARGGEPSESQRDRSQEGGEVQEDIGLSDERMTPPGGAPTQQELYGDSEFEDALRANARSRFEEFLEAERDLNQYPNQLDAPREVFDRYIEASEALVEIFRQVGLPGDSIERGPQPINSVEDIKRAFQRATPEERRKYWLNEQPEQGAQKEFPDEPTSEEDEAAGNVAEGDPRLTSTERAAIEAALKNKNAIHPDSSMAHKLRAILERGRTVDRDEERLLEWALKEYDPPAFGRPAEFDGKPESFRAAIAYHTQRQQGAEEFLRANVRADMRPDQIAKLLASSQAWGPAMAASYSDVPGVMASENRSGSLQLWVRDGSPRGRKIKVQGKVLADHIKALYAPRATVERTEAGEQTVIPGAEKISQREQAQRKADEKLKPATAQKPMDIGLFGDDSKQVDLLDAINQQRRETPPQDDLEAIFDQAVADQFQGSQTNRGTLVIETGAVLRTVSGRETAPVPKVEATSERRTVNTLRRVEQWLIDEAIKELESGRRSDIGQHVLPGIKAMKPGKLSPADINELNLILWGKDTADARDVVRVEKAAEKRAEPQGRSSASWVIREKATGKVVMETFDKKKVDALNTEKYEAIPILEHLQSLNRRSASAAAKSAAKNTAMGLAEVAKGLEALFNPKNKLGSGLTFDEETYAKAKPFFKAGAAHFAQAGRDAAEMVRELVRYLAETAKMDMAAINAMKPYVLRFIRDVRDGKETIDASGVGDNLESDRRDADASNRLGEADVPAPAGRPGDRIGARGGPRSQGSGPTRRSSLPQDHAPVVGESGNLELPERQPEPETRISGRDERVGGGGVSEQGLPFEESREEPSQEVAAKQADLAARRKAQREAESVKVETANRANISATLPMLFPEQQDDVFKAEQRFAKPNGHGMLFTNGTGTGKTFSGLGVVKRFAKQGKNNILIIAPSQGILLDWQRSARELGLEVSILENTNDKGKGIVLTTYANLGQNRVLADRDWDLLVADEAHKLSSDKDGTVTAALDMFRALTLHPRGLQHRARQLFRKEWDAYEAIPVGLTEKRAAAYKAFNEKAEQQIEKWKKQQRPKALLMSATPFSYHFSLDYAEGYLFDYGPEPESRGYNTPDARSNFYIQNFGYRMRTGRLTKPDADVRSEIMEREFHERLKREGALSGRALEVDKDYDRKFIIVDDAVGNRIDQALEFLSTADDGKFRPIYELVSKKFDYLARMRLLEAIKARHAIPFIKENIALGRKVVVFHDYNEGGGFSPFALELDANHEVSSYDSNGKPIKVKAAALYAEFLVRNPWVEDLDFSHFRAPIAELKSAFTDALIYNGTIPKKKRDEAKSLFNDDNGPDIIIVQSAAGEFGISLHDTTGKKQRVLLNLGMPVRPTSAIQQEGRIYRVGQASNAIFRYMSTGTNWERWTFAGKIAERAGTAENLALGNQARTIRQSFIDAFENADDYRPQEGEGTGGKEADRAFNENLSEFEKAKTHYFAQSKNRRKRHQREGIDYFATPEPIGLKMVELAKLNPGEKILEPSAGHGAIARYFPEDASRTIVEPSTDLASRAALVSPGARVIVDRFENLNVVNKFNAIVMNPPFGSGGKTAMDHLVKAASHLANGGRIVALLPAGGMADTRFQKFMESDAAKGLYLAANIDLPSVTFERAGTSVRSHIVVLEKQTDAEVARQIQQVNRDYSDVGSISDLFDRIETLDIRPRLEPISKEVLTEEGGVSKVTVGGVEFELKTDAGEWAKILARVSPNKFAELARSAEAEGGYYHRSHKSFRFDTADARRKFLDRVANPPEPDAQPVKGVSFDTGETTHSKTGQRLFVASIKSRVERSVYDAVNAVAKKHGGYYSAFRGRGAIPGFQFKSAEDRQAFIDEVTGDTPMAALQEGAAFEATQSYPTIDFRRPLTPEFWEYSNQLYPIFRDELDRLGLADIGLRFANQIELWANGKLHLAEGLYLKEAITISLASENKLKILHHEALHALRRTGMFTEGEWSILERAANTRWRDKFNIDTNYAAWPEWVKVEEAIAHAYAAWSNGELTVDGRIARLFKRIRDFLEAIGNALRGLGFKTAEDIFTDIRSGRMAGRPSTAAKGPVAYAVRSGDGHLFKTEIVQTPDGPREQYIIPGTERISDKERAQRKADEPARGKKPQKGVEGLPLFDDIQRAMFALSETSAFKRWFKNSKVVDENGRPLVVYHGTNSAFDTFSKSERGRATKAADAELGFFFTSNPDVASSYADNTDAYGYGAIGKINKVTRGAYARFNEFILRKLGRPSLIRSGQNVMPVYLSMQNPLVEELVSDPVPVDANTGEYNEAFFVDTIRRAIELGHDGVIFRSVKDAGFSSYGSDQNEFAPSDIYVVFEPTQIKSATGNRGTFDPDVADIRFALRADPRTVAERQEVSQGFIARGQPLDRAIRVPFQIFGGTTADGQWKPGLALFEGASKILTEAKFSPESRFAFMNPVLESARVGLVDRYGLAADYVARERQRALDERAVMLQGAEVLKSLKEHAVGPQEAKVLHAILTGENVSDADMARLAEPIRAAVDQLGQEAVALGLLSPESFERNRGAYLHRVYQKYEAEQNGLHRMVNAIMGSRRKKIIGDQFRGRGMFQEVAVDRLMRDVPGWHEAGRGRPQKGEKFIVLDEMPAQGEFSPLDGKAARQRPLRRIYWPAEKAIPSRYSGFTNQGTWEVRGEKNGKIVIWRDFTKEEREKMGEIVDARYTIGKTFMLMAHDLSVGKFYKDIAENEDWARSKPPADKWLDADEWRAQQRRLQTWRRGDVAWVKVPSTEIPNSGGKMRWGALAGKWVREEIWRDLNEIEIMMRPGIWRTLLTQWKLNKTARNPVVHMNNVMSNFVLMDLMDVRWQDFAAGIRSYVSKDKHYEEAFANGAFGADMMTQEIRDQVLRPVLEEIMRDQTFQQGSRLGAMGQVSKFTELLWSKLKALDKKGLDLYRTEDEIFRMATYIRRRELGDTPKEAAEVAREQFIDYDIRAPWVNLARNTVLPFISYTYRAVPLVARAIATRPWKIGKYFLLAWAAQSLAYALMGDDDEDRQRRSLREQEQGYTWIGTERMLRMPFNDSYGNPVFLDIRRWIPAGDVFDMAGSDIPAWLNIGGPLMIGAELFLNRSAFTGQEIVNSKIDDFWDRTGKRVDHLYKSFMPSAAWVPNSWYWEKIANAATGATDRQGRPYSLGLALASSMGIKLKPQDVQDAMRWKAYEFEQIDRALNTEARRLQQRRQRNIISEAEFNRAMRKLLEKKEKNQRRTAETLK